MKKMKQMIIVVATRALAKTLGDQLAIPVLPTGASDLIADFRDGHIRTLLLPVGKNAGYNLFHHKDAELTVVDLVPPMEENHAQYAEYVQTMGRIRRLKDGDLPTVKDIADTALTPSHNWEGIKEFPLDVILSLSTGVYLVGILDGRKGEGVAPIQELMQFLLGYPIFTHDLGRKTHIRAAMKELVTQHPDIPIGISKPYLENYAKLEEVFGKTLSIRGNAG